MAKQRAGWFEVVSWGLGLSLLAFVAAAMVHRWFGQDDAIDAFREAQRQYQAAPDAMAASTGTEVAVLAAAGGAKAVETSPPSASGTADAGIRPAALVLGGDGAVADGLPAAHAAPAQARIVLASSATSSAPSAGQPAPSVALEAEAPVDTSLWSEARIRGYEESLAASLSAPSALLHIPEIDLTVPVLEGVDEVSLNRGVGRIPGTARVGGPGNLGIAGHRDGFFRRLKDIGPGARMELETLSGKQSYTVSDIWIVKPSDVHVLEPTDAPSITLVTCYPFYFVGHAPERYIVRATMDGATAASP